MNLADRSSEPRLTDRRRKEYASLARSKGRGALGQFLVEGVRAVRAALDAGAAVVDVVATAEAAALPELAGVPVLTAAPRDLARISDVTTSQGVVAAVRIPPEARVEHATRLLLLDGVQDPGNVGTLIRTAAWFGFDAVVTGPGTADCFAPKAVRATMGALWDVRIARVTDLAATIAGLRAAGREVWAADLDGLPVDHWKPGGPVALVLGSEAHGVSATVRARCAGSVSIPGVPGRRGTESLNVAAAGAVLMAAVARAAG